MTSAPLRKGTKIQVCSARCPDLFPQFQPFDGCEGVVIGNVPYRKQVRVHLVSSNPELTGVVHIPTEVVKEIEEK